MPSTVVGTCTIGTPRSQVAATNPAGRSAAPPPMPTTPFGPGRPGLPQRGPQACRDIDRLGRLPGRDRRETTVKPASFRDAIDWLAIASSRSSWMAAIVSVSSGTRAGSSPGMPVPMSTSIRGLTAYRNSRHARFNCLSHSMPTALADPRSRARRRLLRRPRPCRPGLRLGAKYLGLQLLQQVRRASSGEGRRSRRSARRATHNRAALMSIVSSRAGCLGSRRGACRSRSASRPTEIGRR